LSPKAAVKDYLSSVCYEKNIQTSQREHLPCALWK